LKAIPTQCSSFTQIKPQKTQVGANPITLEEGLQEKADRMVDPTEGKMEDKKDVFLIQNRLGNIIFELITLIVFYEKNAHWLFVPYLS
jgi:hypothetical protein